MRRHTLYGLIFIVSALLVATSPVSADETKWLAVGMLRDWFSSAGCEVEVGRTHEVRDQLDGLQWPALFQDQDIKAYKALWIGCKNYNDPIVNKTYEYKVVHCGPRAESLLEESEWMPNYFKLFALEPHPDVVVDGTPAAVLDNWDEVDIIDTEIPSDRLLVTTVNTAIGVTETRRSYAFSQQHHDNYIIHDYTFKNTGIIDINGRKVEQTLNDVMIFYMFRWAVSKEGSVYGLNFLPQSQCWGKNTMNDTMWVSDANGAEKYLGLFAWQGLHSEAGYDNIGGADKRESGDGHLTAAQYVGVVVLHADKSAQDKSNDKSQPSTTKYMDPDIPITHNNSQFNADLMRDEYAAMTAGHPLLTHAEEVEKSKMAADLYATSKMAGGGFMSTAGFGPYTLAPGDSIRIVMAEGVNGLNRKLCYEIGRKWKKEETPYVLPNGATTADKNEYKNQWVYTGRDSLSKMMQRAIANFKNGYKVPMPPPAPSSFTVAGGGDRIKLTWANNAESAPGFAGYKIFRAIHTPDTTFDELFACGAGTANPTIVNSYDDLTAVRGFDYYYYIVSFDDGSTNNSTANPGGPLHSGIFYAKTNNPTNLKRMPGSTLDEIRIVPNPFNIRAVDLQYGYSAPDRIAFLNIPGVCTIKIYTERGDLVKTIEHNNYTGDEYWNSITSSQQVVVSGLYIAVFETPEGERAIRKFVIIR